MKTTTRKHKKQQMFKDLHTKDKIKVVLCNVFILATIIGLLYWFSEKTEKAIQARIAKGNQSYEYSGGMITDYKSYKGHSIRVKYRIQGVTYEFHGGWDRNPKGLREGDSIRFRYSLTNPDLIITELEDEY